MESTRKHQRQAELVRREQEDRERERRIAVRSGYYADGNMGVRGFEERR